MSRDVLPDMVKILARQKQGIKLCHINAQSINNKIDEFRVTFENSGVDVVCVSETWLNKNTPDSLVSLMGYKIYRADRRTRGGGVAIYVRKGILCRLVSESMEDEGIEHLFVEINTNDEKLLVGCVYRPYSNISLVNLNAKLETITVEYTEVIIVGDFNSNLLSESTLRDNMAVFGLSPTNITMPTHFTASSNTLLDVFFVSDMAKVQLYDQLSASCFSKHDLIFLSYDFFAKPDEHKYSFRDFNNIDYNVLQHNFELSEWNRIYYMSSVDDQLGFLEDNIIKLYDLSVPLKTRIQRFKSRPWFNAQIKYLIHERNYAYQLWKRFKTEVFRENFRQARKDVNAEIKRAKFEYFTNRFSRCIGTKQTWQIVKEIGHAKSTRTHDILISANEMNESFINLPIVTPDHFHNERQLANSVQSSNTFEFACVSQNDVLSCCLAVKSNAVGYDNVDPKFVKLILPQLLPYITHLFNTVLTSSCFPKCWLHAKIIPIPKSKNEYRPIAILPYFSKVMEKLMYFQMLSHLSDNKLLSKHQSGFRPKHSCITALIDVAENIRQDVDVGKLGILILLDHSKAFDTVDHCILSSKLRHLFNYTDTAVQLVQSYLQGRSQSVFMENDISDPLPLTRGVPQGSILGPLLFSCYVNDLPTQLEYCKIHMYADDVQIYLGAKLDSIDDAVREVNYDLQKIQDWASANGLCLNPLKSKCLVIHGRTRKHNFDVNIVLNGRQIKVVQSVKNLGIIFNNTLTWSNHINSIVGATYGKLRALWATQSFTPQRIRLLLAKSQLMPSLLYGCELFSCCDSVSKRRLNVIFNNICRYVYGVRKHDHITTFSTLLYGVTLDNLFKTRALLLLQKILYSKCPPYLFDRIRLTRSNRGNMLIPLRHGTLVSDWQYYIYTIRLWNSLPHSIQTTSNPTRFKKLLQDYFANLP